VKWLYVQLNKEADRPDISHCKWFCKWVLFTDVFCSQVLLMHMCVLFSGAAYAYVCSILRCCLCIRVFYSQVLLMHTRMRPVVTVTMICRKGFEKQRRPRLKGRPVHTAESPWTVPHIYPSPIVECP